MSSDNTVVAKGSFFAVVDGVERLVAEGETFAADHPIVQGREDSFAPFKVDNQVETATAKPGRKRNARVNRSKPEEKPETTEDTKPDADETVEAEKVNAGPSDFATADSQD